MLCEERDFVIVGYPHFALAPRTFEPGGRHKPAAVLDQCVATVLTFKSEGHVT